MTFFQRVNNVRIAFCLFKYYPFGGLERDFLRIAQACVTRGHEVQVFTQRWQGDIPAGINVNFINTTAWTNYGRAKQFATELQQQLKLQQFDCVIGFNRLPGLDIYFAADPCYRAQAAKKHGWWYRLLPRYRAYAELEKSVFAPSARTIILLLSAIHQTDFIHYYQTPASRFKMIMPGVGEDRKQPENQSELRNLLRNMMQITPDQKILLMVGSDLKRKGVDRALHAIAALPAALKMQTQLWIAGNGKIAAMQKLAEKLAIASRIKFLGPRKDIVSLYAAADMLLHPAYQETAGMVLIEAIVAGLPVIVTANCGYANYIAEAKAGRLIAQPFQQAELNRVVYECLTNAELLKTYQQNSFAYANSHDLFRFAEHVTEEIEHAAKN